MDITRATPENDPLPATIAAALRKTDDPKVRAWLEKLLRGGKPQSVPTPVPKTPERKRVA